MQGSCKLISYPFFVLWRYGAWHPYKNTIQIPLNGTREYNGQWYLNGIWMFFNDILDSVYRSVVLKSKFLIDEKAGCIHREPLDCVGLVGSSMGNRVCRWGFNERVPEGRVAVRGRPHNGPTPINHSHHITAPRCDINTDSCSQSSFNQSGRCQPHRTLA